MEFSIPWENLTVSDIHYGQAQANTRIENGLFVPIFYSNTEIRCQALHILTPLIPLSERIDANSVGAYLTVRVPKDTEFAKKLRDLEAQNLQHATLNRMAWWSNQRPPTYKTAITQLGGGDLEWRIQIPDSGIFSCFDTQRKSWFASNESGLTKTRSWRLLVRTSGLWIDQTAFGMEWKLIGAFVD
jgi:hypothetical protein